MIKSFYVKGLLGMFNMNIENLHRFTLCQCNDDIDESVTALSFSLLSSLHSNIDQVQSISTTVCKDDVPSLTSISFKYNHKQDYPHPPVLGSSYITKEYEYSVTFDSKLTHYYHEINLPRPLNEIDLSINNLSMENVNSYAANLKQLSHYLSDYLESNLSIDLVQSSYWEQLMNKSVAFLKASKAYQVFATRMLASLFNYDYEQIEFAVINDELCIALNGNDFVTHLGLSPNMQTMLYLSSLVYYSMLKDTMVTIRNWSYGTEMLVRFMRFINNSIDEFNHRNNNINQSKFIITINESIYDEIFEYEHVEINVRETDLVSFFNILVEQVNYDKESISLNLVEVSNVYEVRVNEINIKPITTLTNI